MINADTVGGMLDVGRYPRGVDPVIEQTAADINDSGFSSRADENIMRLKYAKLLSNLGNSVQALCGTDAAAGDIIREVRSEALATYEAAGIEFSPDDLGKRSSDLDYGQIEGQPRQGGSSWQSLARGAGSIETDYLNGEITLLGALHGVPTPYSRMLQEVAAEAAREHRVPGSYSVEEMIERAKRFG
jgi:2-dehydropantoate 2-reductase